jgi:hypothetical protein
MNNWDDFKNKLWEEQLNAMDRGFKLEERKNLFVVALFGVGGYGLSNDTHSLFIYLYYLVPLVAVGFDALMLSQKYSVRRIGCFLRLHSDSELEKRWEEFVSKHREKRLRLGAETFTALTFLASLWLIIDYRYNRDLRNIPVPVCLWYLALVVFSVYSKRRNKHLIKELEKACEATESNNGVRFRHRSADNIGRSSRS